MNYGINFLKEIPWNRSTVHEPGLQAPVHRSTNFIKYEPLAVWSVAPIQPGWTVTSLIILVARARLDGGGRLHQPGAAAAAIAAPHGQPELRSEPPRGVAAWVVQAKMMRGHGGTHPRFNRDREWLQGGGQRWLNLAGFDGIARPYWRPFDPKDGFPSFLVLSSRSSPNPPPPPSNRFGRWRIGACDIHFEF
jgi:hypothetical protein